LIGSIGCLALAVGLSGIADLNMVSGAHMSATSPTAQRGAEAAGEGAGGNIALSDAEAMVRSKYGGVAHLIVAQFAAMGDGGADVLLLDVRELEEFQVSRIEGAERVDPGISTSTFLKTYGERAAGKHVVLYCSVGVRSSKLAARVQDQLRTVGALSVSNLEGGIFRWHNEQRPLSDDNGETQLVHKYDAQWGRLVERQRYAVLEYRQ